jgi:anti-anti-sigma regulatory factor
VEFLVAEGMCAIVKLAGRIDVRSIEDSFEKLKLAARSGASLEIDLDDVTDIDLTLLQLIESARKSAAQSGTAVRLSAPAHGCVFETLRRGGFLSDPPDAQTQFWLAV